MTVSCSRSIKFQQMKVTYGWSTLRPDEKDPLTPKVGNEPCRVWFRTVQPRWQPEYMSQLIGNRNSNGLAYIDLRTKKHRYLTTHINWDISHFALSWDGKTIAFISNEDGRDVLHLLETASNKGLPKPYSANRDHSRSDLAQE